MKRLLFLVSVCIFIVSCNNPSSTEIGRFWVAVDSAAGMFVAELDDEQRYKAIDSLAEVWGEKEQWNRPYYLTIDSVSEDYFDSIGKESITQYQRDKVEWDYDLVTGYIIWKTINEADARLAQHHIPIDFKAERKTLNLYYNAVRAYVNSVSDRMGVESWSDYSDEWEDLLIEKWDMAELYLEIADGMQTATRVNAVDDKQFDLVFYGLKRGEDKEQEELKKCVETIMKQRKETAERLAPDHRAYYENVTNHLRQYLIKDLRTLYKNMRHPSPAEWSRVAGSKDGFPLE